MKTITITLTDEQEAALAANGRDLEAFAKNEIDRVSVEWLKRKSNALIETILRADAATVAASVVKLEAVAVEILQDIDSKKVQPVPVPQPVEEVEPK